MLRVELVHTPARGATTEASHRLSLTPPLSLSRPTQNLREAILTFRRYLVAAKDEVKKAEAYRRGLEYLERYYVLISYAVYLAETDIAAAE
jgi:hypothetical protein